MQVIPLLAVPSQLLSVQLGNQACQILLNQKTDAMYLNLYLNNSLVIGGVICENRNRIVRNSYLGFSGDLFFSDTQGNTDPVYTGLADRYSFAYITADELAALGLDG